MTYNIHPIFVHFPIAMLCIYSIIKILPFQKWFPSVAWKDIERILLVVGVLGSFAALATGDTAEHLVHPNRQLVNVHATFAALSTWMYSALLVGEIASIINSKNFQYKKGLEWLAVVLKSVERILCSKAISLILVVVGFIAISVTGMLGGVISYGLSADPFTPLLLKIMGITIS